MWEIKIQDRIARWGKEMTIFRKVPNGYEVLNTDFQTVDTVTDGASALDKHIFNLDPEVFEALVNAIHKDYKPSEGKFTEGKLEATQSHLSDLRQLLKLK